MLQNASMYILYLGPAHTISKSQSQVTWGHSMQSQRLRNNEAGTSHFTRGCQVLSPKYDMDAYMATFFWGEAWTGVANWANHKINLDPTLKTNPANIFDFNDN